MATLVYGVFAQETAASHAITELTRNAPEHPAFAVQNHARGPLSGDDLPESATEIGRNTVIAIIVGGVVGLIIGVVAGSGFDIMGLTPGIGAAGGLLTGILSGLLAGMMAGTRRPKAALIEAAAGLGDGAVLLTVEVTDGGHVELVEGILTEQGALSVDRC
jgi:ABC-type dipeptide/oligopeptide/nickel transport system permease subunit